MRAREKTVRETIYIYIMFARRLFSLKRFEILALLDWIALSIVLALA